VSSSRSPPAVGGRDLLVDRLEVKESPLRRWLERELAHRADYECARTMEDFRRAEKAVTRAGQVKHGHGRHEKDDRQRIDDRTSYVLGWSNEQKIDALLGRMRQVQKELNALSHEIKQLGAEAKALDAQARTLDLLAETRSWRELDWTSVVSEIADLEEERRRIEAGSAELERLARRITDVDDEIKIVEKDREELQKSIGGLGDREENTVKDLAECAQLLESPEYAGSQERFDALAARLGTTAPAGTREWDAAQWTLDQAIRAEQEAAASDRSKSGQRIVGRSTYDSGSSAPIFPPVAACRASRRQASAS
jgi:uncharacterized protein YPO0396